MAGKPFHFELNDGCKQLALASCLPGQWLDDSVINFMVSLLRHQLEERGEKRFILFDTYFWSMLKSADPTTLQRLVRWGDNAARWTASYWLIPMNKRSHWFLTVVALPADLSSNTYNVPIYILDSLQQQNARSTCSPLRDFIALSWRAAHPAQPSPQSATLRVMQLQVPQQWNDFDCGIYLILYMRRFTQQPITTNSPRWFTPPNLKQLRHKLYIAIQQKAGQSVTSG